MGLYYGVFIGALGAYFPYINLFLHERGWSGTQIGFIAGCGPVVGILARPLWGYITDLLNMKRQVLTFLSAAVGLTVWLYVFSDSFVALLTASISVAFFQSAISPIADSMALEILQGRTHYWGSLRLWGSFAYAVVSWATGVVLAQTGYEAIFPIYSGMMIAAIFGTLLLPTRQNAHRAHVGFGADIGRILRTPGFVRFMIAAMCWQAANQSGVVFLSIYLGQLHAPMWSVGIAWSLLALAEGVALRFTSVVIHRFGLQNMLLISGIGQVLRLFGLSFSYGAPVILLVQALFGVSSALYMSGTVLYVNEVFPLQWRATGQSILSTVAAGVGAMAGAAVFGKVLDATDMHVMYLSASAVALVGTLLLVGTQAKQSHPADAEGGNAG